MDAIKPDQERVKNLLLDTVTLLCKNSLQFENYLRVEGLLGVAVDDKDTFFLHISERFQSDAYIERQKQEREEKEAEARREQEEKEEAERAAERASEEAENASRNASEALAIKVKTEVREEEDNDDDDDLVITGSSGLNSPQTVARSATMVAGQRRAQRRTHSPSSSSVHNQSDSANYHQTEQSSPFVHNSDSEDGDGSYSQYDNNQSIKTEQWDGPPAKRQAMSNPWPNVSLGDLSMQAAQATFSDSGDGSFAGGGGDPSEPGCSAWPTNLQLQQSGSQDSMSRQAKLSLAMAECLATNISTREAARKYGVSRGTLMDRVSGKVKLGSSWGKSPKLCSEDEDSLVQYAVQSAAMGQRLTKQAFLKYVGEFAMEKGVPFKGGRPSDKWWQLFRKRHPEMSLR